MLLFRPWSSVSFYKSRQRFGIGSSVHMLLHLGQDTSWGDKGSSVCRRGRSSGLKGTCTEVVPCV